MYHKKEGDGQKIGISSSFLCMHAFGFVFACAVSFVTQLLAVPAALSPQSLMSEREKEQEMTERDVKDTFVAIE